MAGILEVAEVWSSGLAELGPAQPQLVPLFFFKYKQLLHSV